MQEVVYDVTGKKWQVNEFNASDSLVGSYSHLGSFEFERNSLNLIRHPGGFIKNLQSTEYQTGRQNGNIHGANIVSTQKITEGKYEAENQITLLPGFEATAHDTFSAEIKPQSPQYQWQYALTDHLGNLRVLFADKNGDRLIRQDTNSEVNEVLSIRNYSPFGLELGGSHKNLDYQNPYRFGGKEHSNFTGYSDFGWRWLDKGLGRWNTVDPLGEKREWVSSYNFVQNNPISRIDPDGKLDDYALNNDGRIELTKYTNDKFDKLISSNRKEFIINKISAQSKTIISQLSRVTNGNFSNGYTNNSIIARDLYNFVIENTKKGIEFSLTGILENNSTIYLISTSHELYSTSFNKIKINPTDLIFHIHNHDGPITDGNVIGPSLNDTNIATNTLNIVGRSTTMFPRFFITLENGSMIEYFQTGKRSENTNSNIRTINLNKMVL